MNYARIIGTGGYLPENVLTNAELEQRIETTADWIVERTGVEERHIAAPGETTCDLAEQASRPVSYTHLDVYKRQAEGFIRVADLVEDELLLALPQIPRHVDVQECEANDYRAPSSEPAPNTRPVQPFATLASLLPSKRSH